MMNTFKLKLNGGVETAVLWEVENPRHKWLFDYPAQVVLTDTQIFWTGDTQDALRGRNGGCSEASLNNMQQSIKCTYPACSWRTFVGRSMQIIPLITLDVHARDVVQKLIDEKTEGRNSFLWQQQLGFYWIQTSLDVDIKIPYFPVPLLLWVYCCSWVARPQAPRVQEDRDHQGFGACSCVTLLCVPLRRSNELSSCGTYIQVSRADWRLGVLWWV